MNQNRINQSQSISKVFVVLGIGIVFCWICLFFNWVNISPLLSFLVLAITFVYWSVILWNGLKHLHVSRFIALTVLLFVMMYTFWNYKDFYTRTDCQEYYGELFKKELVGSNYKLYYPDRGIVQYTPPYNIVTFNNKSDYLQPANKGKIMSFFESDTANLHHILKTHNQLLTDLKIEELKESPDEGFVFIALIFDLPIALINLFRRLRAKRKQTPLTEIKLLKMRYGLDFVLFDFFCLCCLIIYVIIPNEYRFGCVVFYLLSTIILSIIVGIRNPVKNSVSFKFLQKVLPIFRTSFPLIILSALSLVFTIRLVYFMDAKKDVRNGTAIIRKVFVEDIIGSSGHYRAKISYYNGKEKIYGSLEPCLSDTKGTSIYVVLSLNYGISFHYIDYPTKANYDTIGDFAFVDNHQYYSYHDYAIKNIDYVYNTVGINIVFKAVKTHYDETNETALLLFKDASDNIVSIKYKANTPIMDTMLVYKNINPNYSKRYVVCSHHLQTPENRAKISDYGYIFHYDVYSKQEIESQCPRIRDYVEQYKKRNQ